MIVMILEKVPNSLRGSLTRWLIEPKYGVYIGHVSALVRDRLWEKCVNDQKTGGVIQVWSTNTEQHYNLRMSGDTSRMVIENEGLKLIMIPK